MTIHVPYTVWGRHFVFSPPYAFRFHVVSHRDKRATYTPPLYFHAFRKQVSTHELKLTRSFIDVISDIIIPFVPTLPESREDIKKYRFMFLSCFGPNMTALVGIIFTNMTALWLLQLHTRFH